MESQNLCLGKTTSYEKNFKISLRAYETMRIMNDLRTSAKFRGIGKAEVAKPVRGIGQRKKC